MTILLIKTDQPTTELYLYEDNQKVNEKIWLADRKLGETIHLEIANLLINSSRKKEDLEAVAIYNGPGSFTGLRIGHSVANALAYGLNLPLVATSGDDWVSRAITRLLNGENDKITIPYYGSPARVTKPRK